jgi:hypothetical protein
LWDIKSKTPIHTFNGHDGSVDSVAIGKDGNYIVSGSGDTTIKLWQVINWQNLLAIGCDTTRLNPLFLSPKIDTVPEAVKTCWEYGNWNNSEKAEVSVRQGLALAKEKADLDGAKTKFQQAYQLDSAHVNLAQLETEANQLVTKTLIEQGRN